MNEAQRRRARRLEELVFRVMMRGATAVVLLGMAGILVTVAAKGLPVLTLEMVTRTAEGGFYLGKSGGILNAIVGSLLLAGGATVVSLAASLVIVLYMNAGDGGNGGRRYRGRLAQAVRFCSDVLAGTPSIIYGAFGFTLMLYLGVRASLIGGILTVSVVILPIMIGLMDEIVRNVPAGIREATLSLGTTTYELSFRVILRQASPGLVAAVLISFGRAIGDAAAVIFTAGFSDRIPSSLADPAATLPLAIFFQMATPIAQVRDKAYASAFVLTCIILLVSVGSRIIGKRLGKHTIR